MRIAFKRAAGLALLLALLPVAAASALPQGEHPKQETPVVKAIMLWMESCGQCHHIIDNVLPPLQQQYGSQLEITLFELTSLEDVDMLYQLAGDYGFEPGSVGVPFMLIGERALVGSQEIPQKLPSLIEAYLAAGGVDYPSLQGRAAEVLPQPEAAAALPEPLSPANPAAGAVSSGLNVYFFWGDGCSYCAAQKPAMQDLQERYPEVNVHFLEVWYDEDNRQAYFEMAAAAGFEARSVPATFIGERVWTGWRPELAGEMDAAVQACLESPCPDPGVGITGLEIAAPPQVAAPASPPAVPAVVEEPNLLVLPLIGAVNLDAQSLAFSTAVIAFVDGFNPCSLWVLSILLALVIHSGSRRKTLVVGLSFLLVTASVYGLFIAGLFKVFTLISFIGWVQVVVALLALGFALVNIKDYFWYKEGLSFTISDKHKPKIYRDFRSVLAGDKSIFALIGATVVMALGITLVELPCTAGFPVLWSKLISAQPITTLNFVMLLGLYMLIYLVDELLIFGVAVATLRASKLEEKQGRVLKLVGGMVMLALALVLLFNPDLMNSFVSSLVVFAGAFGATGLVLLLHRVVLPRLGIVIGTEKHAGKRKSRRSRV
jgi:glutaredoxin